MDESHVEEDRPDPPTQEFYRAVLAALAEAEVPVLVGGAFAFGHYTGIHRHTKDFDLFIHLDDVARALAICRDAGYGTELTSPTWIGKVFQGAAYMDFIFSSPSGYTTVDREWFVHAPQGPILGMPLAICPPEEMIWSKAFVADRRRYDGADIAHLLRARAPDLDWDRLLWRFGPCWELLLHHLLLFRFIYPGERDKVPAAVLHTLLDRVEAQVAAPAPAGHICRGTLLSRSQYLVDIEHWGYRDGRRRPQGELTPDEIAELTASAKL